MGYWPDVKRGDAVKHHMVLENNIRHRINALDGFGNGTTKGAGNGTVRIQIWNASGGNLAAGQPVAFDDTKQLCGDALPAVKVTDPKKLYGVCVHALASNEMGDCIIAGPAIVSLSGSSGDFAEPVAGGTGFRRSEAGTARVLFAGSKSMIVLGGAGTESYDGPFAITYNSETGKVQVAAGYINTNGEFGEVGAKNLEPQTGTICVYSEIENSGSWKTPEIKYATPSKYNYPIGTVKVEGSGEAQTVTVCCCRVPVAIIIDAAECPISADAEEDGEGGDE